MEPLNARSPGLWLATVSGQFLCRLPCGPHSGVGRMRHLGRALPCTPLGSEGCWQAPSLPFPSMQQARFWLPSQLQLFLPAGINRPGPVPAQKQLHSCKWILQLPVLNNHVLFLCTFNQLLPSTQRWLQAQEWGPGRKVVVYQEEIIPVEVHLQLGKVRECFLTALDVWI